MNYKVVHVTKAVQNSTVQSRTSTCMLSTVKFVSASKFWSLVILFFPRNRLSRWAKVSMFSIACKRTTEDSYHCDAKLQPFYSCTPEKHKPANSSTQSAHKVGAPFWPKGRASAGLCAVTVTPCDSWLVAIPFTNFQQGSHHSVPAVTSTIQKARAENENAQGALNTTFPGSWGISRAGDTQLWSKKKHVTSEWQENLGEENTIFKFCDYITQPETIYLASLHNSFSVISKVNCFMGVCVNIFSYWLYIHTTGRTHRR